VSTGGRRPSRASAMRSTLYTGGTAPYPARHPETAAAKPPPPLKLLTPRTKRNLIASRSECLMIKKRLADLDNLHESRWAKPKGIAHSLVPPRAGPLTTPQASRHATDHAGLWPAGPFPDQTASLVPGLLAATRTGLTPAGDDELANPKIHGHGPPHSLTALRRARSSSTRFSISARWAARWRARPARTSSLRISSTTRCWCA
jgi:hypothetical protein